MADSIISTLGAGSGIDTKALVTSLVAAQYDPKTKALAAKSETLTAQISGIAQLKSGITGFSAALSALVGGGSLATQPVSADPTIVTAKALAGAQLGGFAAEVEVRQLAAGQLLTSGPYASRTAAVGTGTLTFSFGTTSFTGNTPTGFAADPARAPVTVTIAAGDNSLVGLARAINAANAGVTATIVADAGGAALSLKGPSGETQSFRIDATETPGSPGLSAFAFAPGAATLTLGRKAQDSIVAVDGIAAHRATNAINDLIPGVQLDLVKAELGKTISLTSARPTTAIGQAVNDFVSAFNGLRDILRAETDPATGTLAGDSGARALSAQLGRLTSQQLTTSAPAGAPRTLAEIGVKTNRDGSLSVDNAVLNRALGQYPDAVEALFNPKQASDNALLSVSSGGGKTKPGVYDVSDVKVATAGTLAGTAKPAAFSTALVIDATNKHLTIAVDGGTAIGIDLAEGSYADGAAFAQAVNSAIAAAPGLASRLAVSWSGDHLAAVSNRPGAASAVSIAATNTTLADRIGLTGATTTVGAAASATIAGKPALAIGAFLFAASDSPAAGLALLPAGNIVNAKITIDLGLTQALADISTRLTSAGDGLGASNDRYTKQQSEAAKTQAKITADADALRERLTKQFASLDARVSAYKATQSFLEQQVKAWTSGNN